MLDKSNVDISPAEPIIVVKELHNKGSYLHEANVRDKCFILRQDRSSKVDETTS